MKIIPFWQPMETFFRLPLENPLLPSPENNLSDAHVFQGYDTKQLTPIHAEPTHGAFN